MQGREGEAAILDHNTCLDDVEPRVNPDDARGASQCKRPSESSGDALGTVVVEDLQVDSTAGEAEHHKNPSLE